MRPLHPASGGAAASHVRGRELYRDRRGGSHDAGMSSRPHGFNPNQSRADDGKWKKERGQKPASGSLMKAPSTPDTGDETYSLNGVDPEVYAKARAHFEKVANARLAPFGNTTGADDAVQDAFESLLKTAASRGDDLNELFGSDKHHGLRNRVIGLTAGYQHPDVQNQERHEYIKARKLLAEAEQKHHDEHGRGFNSEERQAAADEIRMTWPAKNRPRANFYEKNTFVSFDAPAGSEEDSATLGDLTQQPSYLNQQPDDFTDENAGFALTELRMAEAADQQAKDKGRPSPGRAAKIRKSMRANVWNDVIVTGSTDIPIPPVKEQHLSSDTASAHRKIVRDAGGASALAARWLDKDPTVSKEQATALFAPFASDDLDASRREAAAIALDERPQFADRLWGEALATATKE